MLIKNLKEIRAEMLNIANEINNAAATDLIQHIASGFYDHMSVHYPKNEILADTNLDTTLFARLHLKWMIQESRRLYEQEHNSKNLILRLLRTYNYHTDNDLFDLIESHLTKAA